MENKEDNTGSKEPVNSEHNKDKTQFFTWRNILSALGVIILLILIIAPNNKDASQHRTSNKKNTVTDIQEIPEQQNGTEWQIFTPVKQDSYVYTFSAIDWDLVTDQNETYVSFWLDNFSRKEGVEIGMRNPFKLGKYRGTCQTDQEIKAPKELGRVLSSVKCSSSSTEGTEIIIVQNKEKPNQIEAWARVIRGEIEDSFENIFTIDLTQIVE